MSAVGLRRLGEPVLAPSLARQPLELDAEADGVGDRSEDVLGDVVADVGRRERVGRGVGMARCARTGLRPTRGRGRPG